MKRRILHLLIALDQFVFVLITLGHANPDETISSAAWRWYRDKKWNWWFCPIIDFIFRPFEADHCLESFLREAWRKALP